MTIATEISTDTSQFEDHHCIEVHCTSCDEALGEDWTIHFDSLAAALAAIRDADWTVDDDEVLCLNCQPDSAEDNPGMSTVVVVDVCEFCWPPLIPGGEPPMACTCDRGDHSTSHYFNVPRITRAHPGFVRTECVTVQCRDCDESYGLEESPAHYRSRAKAIHAVLSDDDPWSQDGTDLFCDRCAARRRCKANGGHTYPEQPNWTNPKDGTQIRYCDDCDEIQCIIPGELIAAAVAS